MPELRKKHYGAIMAEFAILAPFLIIFMFGSIELGAAFYAKNTLNKAVRDGARYISNQTTPGNAEVIAKVEAMMVSQFSSFYPANATTVTIDRNFTVGGLQHVRVQADYNHQYLMGQALRNLLPGNSFPASLQLHAEAVMRFRDEEF